MGLSMTVADQCRHGAPPFGRVFRQAQFAPEWISPEHADRAGLEAFITDTFAASWNARVQHFCDMLCGCRDEDGRWLAAVGFTPLARSSAFLEHYLDRPLEQEIAARAGVAVSRSDLVESGNLAALDAGAARALIGCMTRQLHAQGFRYVALTATGTLLNSFARLRIATVALAEADPHRLPDQGRNWGRYYDSRPHVVFGDIAAGHARLPR